MMLSPSKRGRLPLGQDLRWQPSGEGSSGGMSFWKGKGKEIVREEASFEPTDAALLGDNEDEAEVWKQFREAGLLDESLLERRGMKALLQRISELEKELYDYQYHMGLLLIDKKEWSSKYEMLSQELAEAVHNQKRLRVEHIVAASEFEKKEKSMRNTIETQKQYINSLKSALSEVQGKHAEAEFRPGNKLAQVHHLEENIEDKYLEVKLKVHTLNASLAEASRKSSEINRRLEDVEAREGKFQKEYSSFFSKKRKIEEDLDQQKEDLLAWERELQECQKKLSKGQYSLDEKETETNDRERILKKREKELEEAWKNLWISDDSLKLKEQDISMRIQALENKEKNVFINQENLVKKEKDLLAREELSKREKVEISKLTDYQNLILVSKKKDIELNQDEKYNSLNEQLRMKIDIIANKEVTLENIEKEIFEREQVLERKIEKLKDKEKENEKILNSLKESLVKQLEDLRRDRDRFEKEWEFLDERQLSLEMALDQFNCDKERFAKWKSIEEEKLQHEKLEMTDRLHKLLEDLKQNKRSFEDVIACLKLDEIGIQKDESNNIASQFDAKDTLKNKERLEATKDGMSTDLNAPRSLKFDVILSAKSAEASPQSTCPQSVSLEGHTSWLQRCSRLLSFSYDKRVAQPTGILSEKPTSSDACLYLEALQHKTSVGPEELLQVVNNSSDTRRIQTIGEDPIIIESKRSCRVNDTAEPSSGIAHSSTNNLKSQPNNDAIVSSDKEASSMHHQIDSAHQLFRKRRWRSGSVFVKKTRSVNALLEDDKASSQQYSQQKHSGCSTSEAKVHSANVDKKANYSLQRQYDRSRARNNELDSMELDEDYHSLSSQEYVKDDISPEIEVPGLKHYNFRHSTIMRAVAVAETMADRVKRRKKEEHLQSHEEEAHKVIMDDEEEKDDEEEMEHSMESSDSDWLESQLRDT